MDVINEEEKAILDNIRMRRTNQCQPTHQIRKVVKKPSMNQPFYAPQEAYSHYNNQHFYYPPLQQNNAEDYEEPNYNYY